MRKELVVVIFLAVLLVSAVVGTQLVNLAVANPMFTTPDARTKPPTITIYSTIVNGNNVSIDLKVNVGESSTAHSTRVDTVYYVADCDQNVTYIYRYYNFEENVFDTQKRSEFSYKLNLTEVPEGNHSVKIYSDEYGLYGDIAFFISGSSSVNFTVDTNPPSISLLSIANVKYEKSEIPLSFIISEPALQVSYVLDGQENVTIAGNTTLTGLSNGLHNVTVYAWDFAGNVGVSETVSFTVAVPQSTIVLPVLVVAASAVSVIVAVAGLRFFFRRCRQQNPPEYEQMSE